MRYAPAHIQYTHTHIIINSKWTPGHFQRSLYLSCSVSLVLFRFWLSVCLSVSVFVCISWHRATRSTLSNQKPSPIFGFNQLFTCHCSDSTNYISNEKLQIETVHCMKYQRTYQQLQCYLILSTMLSQRISISSIHNTKNHRALLHVLFTLNACESI